ncbi:MAG: hypothetical protein GY854_02330 [Deltaproteobacteria bacterium]|nr:hypothetical protein [Deltaproteobacteria bacterium]
MAYKRITVPRELPRGVDLTRAMVGAGMRLASKPSTDPNIEDTLLAVSIEGMDHHDLRVLSVLVTWIQTHHPWINADRLTRVVSSSQSPRVQAFWTATAAWLHKDRRFARMTKLYSGPCIDVLHVGTNFQIMRKGEDPRFENSFLRVPAGILRDRASDVMKPSELARIHRTYRQRVLMGPSYRADMWAVLENEPTLSASELARRTYGSFATAWQVKHDFKILAA